MFGRSKKDQSKTPKKIEYHKLVELKQGTQHVLPVLPSDKVACLVFAYVGPMNEVAMILQVCLDILINCL